MWSNIRRLGALTGLRVSSGRSCWPLFQNHLSDVGDRAGRLKRGGGQEFVQLDAQEAEERYRLEPVEFLTPEKIFDARWAMTVLGEALKQLREDYEEIHALCEALIASEGRLGP
jgi:hypothetical protein